MGAVDRVVRIGAWLLPVYGALLGLSTLTHQPPVEDFTAYARYVTTDSFLVSHLVASILGAAVGVLGVVAITAVLVRGRRAGAAVIGLALTTVANVLLTAVFGSAAFVQPAIGRAHLAGVPGMPEFNADSAYGPVLLSTAVLAQALFVAAAVVTGVAVAGTDRRLRWPGAAYAILLPSSSWPASSAGRCSRWPDSPSPRPSSCWRSGSRPLRLGAARREPVRRVIDPSRSRRRIRIIDPCWSGGRRSGTGWWTCSTVPGRAAAVSC